MDAARAGDDKKVVPASPRVFVSPPDSAS